MYLSKIILYILLPVKKRSKLLLPLNEGTINAGKAQRSSADDDIQFEPEKRAHLQSVKSTQSRPVPAKWELLQMQALGSSPFAAARSCHEGFVATVGKILALSVCFYLGFT